MSTADVPLPAHLAIEDEPFSDHELATHLAGEQHWSQWGVTTFHEDGSVSITDTPLVSTERVEAWRIEADDQAEWAGRKLALAAEQVRVAREQADEWVARIEHDFDAKTKGAVQSCEFFEGMLQDYALRVRQAGGPATLHLPSVTVGTTYSKPAVKVDDDETLARLMRHRFQEEWDETWTEERAAAWVKALQTVDFELDDLVKTTPKVYVVPLRKLVHVEEIDEDVWDFEAILECGHKMTGGPVFEPDDFAVPQRSELVDCADCKGHVRRVEATVSTRRKRLAAVGPDGVEVPGCTVSDEAWTATVKVR